MPGSLSFFSGDTPTAAELERAAVANERLGLVIRVRWLIIAALVAYSVVTFAFYDFTLPFLPIGRYLFVPAVALVLVALYNAWYQLSYERLSHLRYLPHFQILIDIIVATVLIHYSGGVNSWFWTMYLLFSVESAFILEEEGDTWLLGAAGTLIYGGLLTAEYYNIIPPVAMPFIGTGLSHNFTYVMILWSWVVVMNAMVVMIGNAIMSRLRSHEADLRASAVFDRLTGLYNRTQFRRILGVEVERARRYKRRLSVMLVEIDDFGAYAERWGHVEGTKLVRLVAEVVRTTVRRSDGEEPYEIDVPGRHTAERIAVLAPEIDGQDAVALAERLREALEAVCVPRRGSPCKEAVTVSVGIASYPGNGLSGDELLAAAATVLDEASQSGKNKVSAAAPLTA